MYRRETDQIESDSSLWKYNDKDDDEPLYERFVIVQGNECAALTRLFCSYQHVLSGAKLPRRAEARGGIIADEMGLGKSLVIISTVASSLARAKEFVAAENQQRQSQPGRNMASGATLIIVPSSRKSTC